jgi:hypothetical protein
MSVPPIIEVTHDEKGSMVVDKTSTNGVPSPDWEAEHDAEGYKFTFGKFLAITVSGIYTSMRRFG